VASGAEKDDVWRNRQIKVDCEARLWSELTALGRLCADLPTSALRFLDCFASRVMTVALPLTLRNISPLAKAAPAGQEISGKKD
jgi:hypothetical protein